ncbi:GMC family oxidoreductase [Halopseudomonas pertucinogena]|uniref:Choline dehydrogenase n=1 Tax=Halopseudomonas pertucinogena TaxID=86175 RepID=A0ABQ2CPF3_9GAMM|nr:GMC family oxidoreductase [Halopseudomonas pertucinogena]GGI98688.1 choline dehydrogenase [Halopseudomonas pertucinogena]
MAEELSADFVVVGSGICGALVAMVLAQRGASVIMLEAGPRVERAQLVANFRNSPRRSDWMSPYPFSPWAPHPVYRPEDNEHLVQAGPYPYPAEYIRMVGGSTWHWAALAWRNVPNDMRMHSLYGVGVDWPFDYDELDPYYQWAEELMGVAGDGDEHPDSPRSQPYPMEPVAEPWAMRRIRERLAGTYRVANNPVARNSRTFDRRPACCGSNNCQPICPVDAQYHGGIAAAAAEAAGVRLISSAVVYKLEHDSQDRIVAAHYYDPERNSYRVTGGTFVVAANGIETPRLLLMSTSDRFPNGIANRTDMVGRHLMDHPSTSLTFDADEDLWLGRGPQSPSSISALRDGPFREDYSGYRLDFTNISRVDSTTQRLLLEGVYGPEFERRLRHSAAREMSVKTVLEVLPRPENRIALSSRKDALGLPRPQAHYDIDTYTRRGAESALWHFRRIAELMGGSNLRFSDENAFANNQHICGTTSMGEDPNISVCDGWGRTHDHENLFLVGTGVLPTAGTANSTLTAVAVALRSVDAMLPAERGWAAEQGKS